MVIKKKDTATEQNTETKLEQTAKKIGGKKSPNKSTTAESAGKEDTTKESSDTKADEGETGFTEDEKKVIGCNGEDISVANTKKMEMATQLLASQFNIDESFYLTKMDDRGNTMTLGFANMDYDVTIKIKNVEEMGIIPE